MINVSKEQILKELSLVPKNRLSEVESYIRFIISETVKQQKIKEPETLAGIWKGKGFEKLVSVETEVKNMRNEIANQIIAKYER